MATVGGTRMANFQRKHLKQRSIPTNSMKRKRAVRDVIQHTTSQSWVPAQSSGPAVNPVATRPMLTRLPHDRCMANVLKCSCQDHAIHWAKFSNDMSTNRVNRTGPASGWLRRPRKSTNGLETEVEQCQEVRWPVR